MSFEHDRWHFKHVKVTKRAEMATPSCVREKMHIFTPHLRILQINSGLLKLYLERGQVTLV